MTRIDYLKARGWFRFAGDLDRWYRFGTDPGVSEEEAERQQLDSDETALRYLLDRRPILGDMGPGPGLKDLVPDDDDR